MISSKDFTQGSMDGSGLIWPVPKTDLLKIRWRFFSLLHHLLTTLSTQNHDFLFRLEFPKKRDKVSNSNKMPLRNVRWTKTLTSISKFWWPSHLSTFRTRPRKSFLFKFSIALSASENSNYESGLMTHKLWVIQYESYNMTHITSYERLPSAFANATETMPLGWPSNMLIFLGSP